MSDSIDLIDLEAKGNALFNVKKYYKAIEYYDKILAIDPHCNSVLDKKELALLYLEEDYEKIEIMEMWLVDDPTSVAVLNGLAQSYYNVGQIDKATEYTNKVLSIDPKNANTKYDQEWLVDS